MFKKRFIFYPILFAGIIYPILKIVSDLGIFEEYHQTPKDLKCGFFETQELHGPYDLTKITEDLLLISQDERYDRTSSEIKNGSLKLFDLKGKKLFPLRIENFDSIKKFHPEGLYYSHSEQKLYVINHPKNGGNDKIEVFNLKNIEKIDSEQELILQHQYSLIIPENLHQTLKDLIMVGNDKFFITQTYGYNAPLNIEEQQKSYFMQKHFTSVIFDYKNSNIQYCFSEQNNGNERILKCQIIPKTYDTMITGISWDRNNTVMISNIKNRKLTIFEYDENSQNKLNFVKSVKATGHCDNIAYDQQSDKFYVAGFMRYMEVLMVLGYNPQSVENFLEQPERNSWSFMDEISVKSNKEVSLKNLLVTNHANVSASVGIVYKNNEYVLGSWIDKSINICSSELQN